MVLLTQLKAHRWVLWRSAVNCDNFACVVMRGRATHRKRHHPFDQVNDIWHTSTTTQGK